MQAGYKYINECLETMRRGIEILKSILWFSLQYQLSAITLFG